MRNSIANLIGKAIDKVFRRKPPEWRVKMTFLEYHHETPLYGVNEWDPGFRVDLDIRTLALHSLMGPGIFLDKADAMPGAIRLRDQLRPERGHVRCYTLSGPGWWASLFLSVSSIQQTTWFGLEDLSFHQVLDVTANYESKNLTYYWHAKRPKNIKVFKGPGRWIINLGPAISVRGLDCQLGDLVIEN